MIPFECASFLSGAFLTENSCYKKGKNDAPKCGVPGIKLKNILIFLLLLLSLPWLHLTWSCPILFQQGWILTLHPGCMEDIMKHHHQSYSGVFPR